jgi:formylmethanofuran dehydrogenase subunit C
MSDSSEQQARRFSLSSFDMGELMNKIREIDVDEEAEKLPEVTIDGIDGQANAFMHLAHPVRLALNGALGDYAFAFNELTDVQMTGNVGHGVGEGMKSGAVRIRGNAGEGAGCSMTGGTLAIYGSAGDRCGAAMRGGGIFVRGDVGKETGIGALGGTIVIGGDAGKNLGDAASNVTIFIRGQAESLASGVTEAPLRQREQVRLGLLLINASIRGDAKDFRRIVPRAMLEAETSKPGELNPNWR